MYIQWSYFCLWKLTAWFWRGLLEESHCFNHVKPLLNVSSILLYLVGQRLKLGDCLGAVRGKEER